MWATEARLHLKNIRTCTYVFILTSCVTFLLLLAQGDYACATAVHKLQDASDFELFFIFPI